MSSPGGLTVSAIFTAGREFKPESNDWQPGILVMSNPWAKVFRNCESNMVPATACISCRRDLYPSSFSQAETRALKPGISRLRCVSLATFRSSNGKDGYDALRRG